MLWVNTRAADNLRQLSKSIFFRDKAFRCWQCRPQGKDRRCFSDIIVCLRGKFCIQIDVEVEADLFTVTNARPILAEKMSGSSVAEANAKARRERNLKNFN